MKRVFFVNKVFFHNTAFAATDNMTDEEIEFINRVFNIKSVVENERRNQAPAVQDEGK